MEATKWIDSVMDFGRSLFISGGKKSIQAAGNSGLFPTGGGYRTLTVVNFDGEKNLGEMGPIRNYALDYAGLSLRSWQLFLESTEAETVLNKFCTWVIGKGLKLQAEPVKALLGKKNDALKKFSDEVESRWNVYAKSKLADFSNQDNLHKIAHNCYKNSIIGGDVLVVLRFIDGIVKVQLVDSFHLQSPVYGSEWFPAAAANGNRIINGIEFSATNEHVAYYVKTDNFKFERIKARGQKSGRLQAFIVYGKRYRLDNVRGIPLLSAVMESMKIIDRYKEATLGQAEEQAKVAFQVTHELGGSGEFPLAKSVVKAYDFDGQADLPTDSAGKQLANTVAATTQKTAVNNPPGAKIEPIFTAKGTLYFKDFYTTNIDAVCSAIEMPPNVATSKYDSNYSASRAAIKDWEHTLSVKRSDFAFQFYQNVYNYWLEMEIYANEIQAPGYLIAKVSKDEMTLEAYRTTRWVGAPVANIDPVKEVQAERAKLGITAESIPLTTVEAATEALSGGDSDHNMEQYSEELALSKTYGLRPEPEVKQQSSVSDN
jgi:capsid protein